MEIDLNGKWEGVIKLGKEYGENSGKEIIYNSELSQIKNTISGISTDVSGFGINPEPADINGKIKGLKINFTKQYRTNHIIVENNTIEIDSLNKGPKIQYDGIFNKTTNSFEGNWMMPIGKKFFGLITLNVTGTWNMKKVTVANNV
ncbi:hypothetical protein M4I21_17700 [Cellulophaga sp. 20_2_10]|uniref:hypothetical protein n=1 Tax=Cellulophaga sp. 20_2_10 TaxID=2942476 RepID=UPI00201AF655|nr:hypothetical protein [Cellulophaga sp. 20_2_10]MCL5247656.1 hypothetical protein [Cellulophaga sp. 20_2_10]